jgi:hypothetical protein
VRGIMLFCFISCDVFGTCDIGPIPDLNRTVDRMVDSEPYG